MRVPERLEKRGLGGLQRSDRSIEEDLVGTIPAENPDRLAEDARVQLVVGIVDVDGSDFFGSAPAELQLRVHAPGVSHADFVHYAERCGNDRHGPFVEQIVDDIESVEQLEIRGRVFRSVIRGLQKCDLNELRCVGEDGDHVLKAQQYRVETEYVIDHQHPAMAAREGPQFPCLGRSRSQGFFH